MKHRAKILTTLIVLTFMSGPVIADVIIHCHDDTSHGEVLGVGETEECAAEICSKASQHWCTYADGNYFQCATGVPIKYRRQGKNLTFYKRDNSGVSYRFKGANLVSWPGWGGKGKPICEYSDHER